MNHTMEIPARQTDRKSLSSSDASDEVAFPGRRSFLAALLGVGTVTVGALLSVPLVRFALYPIFAKTSGTAWSDVGAVDEFSSLTTPVKRLITVERLDGWREMVSQQPVYLTRAGVGELRVLSAVCPHLGCSVAWHEGMQQFTCPCHQGVFAPDGALISGPPPRPMDALNTRVENGRLQVQYQYFRKLVPYKEVIG